ncbi:peptidoglycan DD-metalloendopeptidase family protein [Alkaliphilus transvaalensis]|uniref:peptidoglycan DD-metalloendopeptidase family protein n=1 Tax=Alkaliphilus transvaalensis TaxID=114628 RepID=UPI0006874D4F|nr:M23 family metallopeptidase [Alkaliphilus transvaalensis]
MNQKNMELYKKKLKLMLKMANIKLIKTTHSIKRNIHNLMITYHKQSPQNLKKYKIIAASTVVVFILSIALLTNYWMNQSLAAISIEIDNQVIGVVRAEEDFWNAVDIVKGEIEGTFQQEMSIADNVTIKTVKADDTEITNHEIIVRNIKKQLDLQVKSVAIVIDGTETILVKDYETAEAILEALREPFNNQEGTEYLEIDFSESVELVAQETAVGDVRSFEDALNYIIKGSDEEQIHEVASGESTWTIARKYNLTVEDIAKANPDLNPERLSIGQQISLVVPKPFITVRTKEYAELIETIPYETTYEETTTLYKGDQKIVKQGIEGERELKAYIIKENGVEIKREVLEEKVISQPTERVIAQGTTPRPATVATGVFASPTRGTLTSRFGMRWGSMHQGIDVAASTGTPINAADAGKVTFSGVNGAYGNLVIIDHENGYQTYYAHANRLLVKKGDRVHKGQQIATVGSTGRSTGPHLHFEVRKNGQPLNPLNFVRY